MKKIWKGYLSYIPKLYQLLMFLGFPILIWIAYGIVQSFATEENIMFIFVGIFAFIEVMADYFPFGGINSRKNMNFDFLNTSNRGEDFLRKVLVIDGVRRLLSYFIIMVGCQLIYIFAITGKPGVLFTTISDILCYVLFSTLAGFGITTLVLLVVRFFDVLAVSMLGGYAAVILLSWIFVGLFSGAIPVGWILISILAIIDVVIEYLLIKISSKRIKESYYDK